MSKGNSPVPHPKISIVIPVYNGSNFLAEAIDSALAQDYDNFEIIVVNDGSNDGGKTEKIALSYGKKIRYFSKPNGGVATALNLGIEKMTGDYFSWLSHDDLYYPYKLSSQFAALEGNDPENTIVYSGHDLVDQHGIYYGEVSPDREIQPSKRELPLYALFRSVLNGCAMLIPRSFFTRFGVFDPALPSTQDYALWFHFMKQPGTRLVFCPVHGVKSRHHANQGTNTISDHFSCCSHLWISMMEQTAPDQRKALYGNEYAFFKRIADHLEKYSPYTGAIEFARNQLPVYRASIEEIAKKATVSVVIPFFNQVEWILESVNSVLAQTHSVQEILLLDDGSEEDISPILALCKKEPRIRYFHLDHAGVSAARNRGIDEAAGDYIAFLDSNDLWEKDKLEKQLLFMLENGYRFSTTAYRYFDEGVEENTVSGTGESGYLFQTLLKNSSITTPTVLLERAILLQDNFRFNESLGIGKDICMWLAIAYRYETGIDNRPLTRVRMLGKNAISSPEKRLVGTANILNYLLANYSFDTLKTPALNLLKSSVSFLIQRTPRNRRAERTEGELEEELEILRERYSNLLNTFPVRWANRIKRLFGKEQYR